MPRSIAQNNPRYEMYQRAETEVIILYLLAISLVTIAINDYLSFL